MDDDRFRQDSLTFPIAAQWVPLLSRLRERTMTNITPFVGGNKHAIESRQRPLPPAGEDEM